MLVQDWKQLERKRMMQGALDGWSSKHKGATARSGAHEMACQFCISE